MQTDSKISNIETILIKINGENKFIPQNISIVELLEIFKINKERVVIELNKEILRKDGFSITTIKENDEIEIVTFVGGG